MSSTKNSSQWTLIARRGDLQALKVLAAAQLAGTRAITYDWSSSPSDDVFEFRILESNRSLRDANAAARLVGLASLALPPRISHWLHVEETQLHRAVYTNDAEALHRVFEMIASSLGSSGYLDQAASPSLADAILLPALLACSNSNNNNKSSSSSSSSSLPPLLAAYFSRLESAFRPALDSFLTASTHGSRTWETTLAEDRRSYTRRHVAILPHPGKRNILITSALPYVNNVPHLGNIIGCVLSADVYARFARERGYNVLYVCGTDEYGTATETKALEEGLSCQEICDKYHEIHREIYKWFGIDFDKFGRTPTRMQTQIAQDIFHDLEQNGHVLEQSMEQLYSEALGKFLADRYVVGTCPKCKYEDARGDQCDGCGALLNPTELINARCKFSNTKPVTRSTRHMFLNLPALTAELTNYISTTSQLGGWSANCVATTESWLKQGLKPRCITRDLKWGTPVPRVGFENKVFYVWFDAPIGYISITANYTEQWESWWKNPDQVEMVQFMGKDNVPFHTVIFPSTQLGTKGKWTMMKNISVTEYLNYEGGKFSKSRGVGVFGNDALATDIPVEVWRYYLLSNRPESSDSDFQWSDLAARNNGELLNNLGNFVNRTVSFVNARLDAIVPRVEASDVSGRAAMEACVALGEKLWPLGEQYIACMEAIKLRQALHTIMAMSRLGNQFLQEQQAWVSIKTDPQHAACIMSACLGMAALFAALLEPFMPTVTEKIFEQLALPRDGTWSSLRDEHVKKGCLTPHLLLPPGHKIHAAKPMFRTITDEEVAALREKFAGNQADRT